MCFFSPLAFWLSEPRRAGPEPALPPRQGGCFSGAVCGVSASVPDAPLRPAALRLCFLCFFCCGLRCFCGAFLFWQRLPARFRKPFQDFPDRFLPYVNSHGAPVRTWRDIKLQSRRGIPPLLTGGGDDGSCSGQLLSVGRPAPQRQGIREKIPRAQKGPARRPVRLCGGEYVFLRIMQGRKPGLRPRFFWAAGLIPVTDGVCRADAPKKSDSMKG